MPGPLSLFSVNAVLIMSADDGSRIFAKYYSAPHPPTGTAPDSTDYPGANPYPTVKEQRAFEKGLLEKTNKSSSDVILYDNRIVVFKMESDVMLYVVGSADENEVLLYNVVLSLRDALGMLFKGATDKRTIVENYDLVSLAIDETIDDGIILETDPVMIASRVSRAPAADAPNMKNIDLTEQGLMNAWEFGKRRLAEGLRHIREPDCDRYLPRIRHVRKFLSFNNSCAHNEAEILIARCQESLQFYQVITQELAAELVNLRVSNIYDLSSRIFLFKLAKPDHRRQLIVDSGFRTHVTQYSRTAASAPSPFVTRMRKFLKSRRITSITQIGTDRVIDISFSDGTYHMFLEFFAGGNIIVTDRDYTIIALFRQVTAAEGEEAKLGLKYNVTNKQNYGGVPDITDERVKQTLEKAKTLFAGDEGASKKMKKKNTDVLRKALSQGFPEYPPLLLDHAFAVKEFDPATPLDQVLGDEAALLKVRGVLKEAQRVSNSFGVGENHPGYIVAKEDKRASADGESASKTPGLLYEDFHPFKPRQFEGKPGISILEFDRFNATVDEYFSSLESQRLESRLTEKEEAAKRKLESVREEHRKRIDALKDAQELHIRKAGAIQDNMYRVQEAMDAVNGLIAQGMDWGEIARLIEMEQGRGNPVAQIIKLPLKLYENTITLLLAEAGDDEEEDDEEELASSDESESDSESGEREEQRRADATSKLLTIDIDLGMTPWANASQYYDQKKQASEKQQRTAQSSSKALKSHEKKVTADLKKSLKQEKQVLRQARVPFWFEKFVFFISSEGYLVIGARDAMQSELLYRRYLSKGDIFIHADLEGALPIVVKNRTGNADAPISPSTLSQAGNMCVATSTAWDSKAVMSAWWVHAHQVSKTAQVGGGILPTGRFEVKGEKNFLAPSQLVLGFAVLWQISQESVKNHKQLFDAGDVPVERGDANIKEAAEAEQGTATEAATVEEVTPTVQEAREDEKHHEASADEEAEEDEEEEDQTPARNPLQHGDSALPVQHSLESGPKSETEDEDEDKEDAEQESVQDEQAAEGTDEASSEQPAAREQRQGKPTIRPGEADTKASRAPPTRGKKAKDKRAAAKYAHQDDEERELALRLLGSNKGKAAKAAKAAEAKAQREREAEAQRLRRRAQHERAAEAERKRQALFEEGGDDYNEEIAAAEAADLSWLPALVGTPSPDDEILGAIAVCAPWAALGRYKYKVKLQPGAVKKGKAVKEIVGRWVSETTTGKVKKEYAEDLGISRVDAEKLRAREGELIKGWKETEIINTMPVGKVRIMTPGSGGGGGGGDKGKGSGAKGGRGGGKGGKKK
ncbi:Nuclear export mediator factor Nemf [Penicillium rolfsii]|nr:Nuclear export mediator factor Nemf [Penicillium rolfsii]